MKFGALQVPQSPQNVARHFPVQTDSSVGEAGSFKLLFPQVSVQRTFSRVGTERRVHLEKMDAEAAN